VAKVLDRLEYRFDASLICVRWYLAYPLSLQHLAEMMCARGIPVDVGLCTAGPSSCCRYWRKRFAAAMGALLDHRDADNPRNARHPKTT